MLVALKRTKYIHLGYITEHDDINSTFLIYINGIINIQDDKETECALFAEDASVWSAEQTDTSSLRAT